MSSLSEGVRQRSRKKKADAVSVAESTSEEELVVSKPWAIAPTTDNQTSFKVALAVVAVVAVVTRFYNLGHPSEVVFDEVHFGKVWLIFILQFSSANYCFSLHPTYASYLTARYCSSLIAPLVSGRNIFF
jgi:dolichyl-phosphate-mannose-protein mannosyltransferase